MPLAPETSEIIVSVGVRDYAASNIARAVEDCDAHLLLLSVVAADADEVTRRVLLRIDRRDPSAVARSLERYGMTVESMTMPETTDGDDVADRYDEVARRRARELLRILSV